jgi:hypothetical protein
VRKTAASNCAWSNRRTAVFDISPPASPAGFFVDAASSALNNGPIAAQRCTGPHGADRTNQRQSKGIQMNRTSTFRPVVAFGLMVAAGITSAWAADASAPALAPADASLSDIQACMNHNLVQRGALRDLNVKVTDREGGDHGLRMKLYWKPTTTHEPRVQLRLLEPMAMRGSSYLLLQDGAQEQVYFHLPNVENAVQITGKNMSEPLWGTDFSYGEIKQVLGLLFQGKTRRIDDASIDQRPVYVLDTEADADASGYQSVRSYVDQATCVLLKSEFFAKGETPVKTLSADVSSLITLDDYSVVLGYTMRNHAAGSQTVIELSDFTLLEHLPDWMFDPGRFFQPYD